MSESQLADLLPWACLAVIAFGCWLELRSFRR